MNNFKNYISNNLEYYSLLSLTNPFTKYINNGLYFESPNGLDVWNSKRVYSTFKDDIEPLVAGLPSGFKDNIDFKVWYACKKVAPCILINT